MSHLHLQSSLRASAIRSFLLLELLIARSFGFCFAGQIPMTTRLQFFHISYSPHNGPVASAPLEKGDIDVYAKDDDYEQKLSSTNANKLKTQDSQRERFHCDMRRVLSARTDRGIAALAEQSIRERRQRPDIIEHDKDGVQRVFTMLDRMVQMGLATEETFQIAMRACAQRGRLRWRNSSSSNGDRDATLPVICAADQMEMLLQRLENLTSDISLETFSMVLEAYATCSTPRGGKYYANKAEDLLHRMEERGLFSATDAGSMNSEVDIPVEILAHVLHAWAWQQVNLQDSNCAQRAQEYLERIEQSRQECPSAEIILQCYNWVLEAWSKSGSPGSSDRAMEIFSKMKHFNQTQSSSTILNTQTYSNIILARSKNREPQAAQQAHGLLVEMLEYFKEGAFPDSEPELIAFNGVITAWARNGKPKKAEDVLWLMDKIRPKCKDLVPDVVTYNSVLHAHVMSSNRQEGLENIHKLVNFMESNCEEQPAICPDSFTYNTLMKVCQQSLDR